MDLFSLSSLLLLLAMLLLGLSSWQLFSRRRPKINLPPGPLNLPIVGCLHLLGSLPHVSLHNLSTKFGGIMYLKIGTVPLVVVSSQDVAEELYKYHGLKFASKAPSIAGMYFGNNFSGIIFSEYTKELKLYRKLTTIHLLSSTRLKVYAKVRREEQCGLVESIFSEQGKPIKLRDKFHHLNMNIITYMLFGERFYGPHAENTPELDVFVEAVIESLRVSGIFNMSDYIPAIRWMDFQGLEKRYKQLMAKVNHYLLSILQDRRRNPRKFSTEDPVPFLDLLLSLDATEEQVSDTTKLSLLFDMLLGAIDTSATSLEWAIAELIRHPEVLQRARKEVESVVGESRLVEESDLAKLPYVEAIAKETLRLHQLAPLALPKIVRGGPCILGGYTIPEGTHALVNFHSLGIDAHSWKGPLNYSPERFLDESVDVFGQDFKLLPFGSGRRMCPGAKLGFDALQIGIALLVQGFEWTLPGGQRPSELNMDETYGLACHKTQPLVVIAKPLMEASVYE